MSEATNLAAGGTLELSSAWRLPDRDEGATVHELRVVQGSRSAACAPERDELRALIADVVRQELRSELGRQMTRSIRSLVREEVARIFARLGTR
jgi:hypothetical protein